MPRSSRDIQHESDLAQCRATLCGGSRSFFIASFLLPRAVHLPAAALYAFCRVADDAVDADGARPEAVARLSARLDRAYAGDPLPDPVDRAFARVVAAHGIPRALPEALLEGFAWDFTGRGYDTMAELHDYAARVAGSVGAMMAVLMGARSAEALARACDLGVAMQLTNIARDVGEDARAGRLYLPRSWLREAGIDADAFLSRPVFSEALGSVISRLLDEAAGLYVRGTQGIAHLPAGCRPGIRAAGLLYAEIGREVARAGHDSVSTRARVSFPRKAAILARALPSVLGGDTAGGAPALDAVRYLVDAAAIAGAGRRRPFSARHPLRHVEDRAVWVIELFGRLQAQQGLRRMEY